MKKIKSAPFYSAVKYVSPSIGMSLLGVSDETAAQTYEIRLRSERPVMLCGAYGSKFLFANGRTGNLFSEGAVTVSVKELDETFTRLCGYSVHAHADEIASGFLTVAGGHRAGICGSAVIKHGRVEGVREISSVNLRIARENKDAAKEIYQELFLKGLNSVVIAGAPSSGKTTMLRDLARRLSEKYRVSVIDERGELACARGGVAQLDVGIGSDVFSGYPKAEAIHTALRAFSPEMIVCDEVGSREETEAVTAGFNSGVHFAVSVHASSFGELVRRPQARKLILSGAFDFAVLLSGSGEPCKIENIIEVGELIAEIRGHRAAYNERGDGGELCFLPKKETPDPTSRLSVGNCLC